MPDAPTSLKPVLFLDVDGPLNPWRLVTKKGYTPPRLPPDESPYTYEKHLLRPRGWHDETSPPLPVLLSRAHGDALRDLAEVFTLVWATTWEDEANTLVAPLVGLPTLPVVHWPDNAREWALHPRHRGSWKTKHLLDWVDGFARVPGVDLADPAGVLPWAFVDDEVNGHDRALLRSHYGYGRGETPTVPTLLLRVEPTHGLRSRDFVTLRVFAERARDHLAARV